MSNALLNTLGYPSVDEYHQRIVDTLSSYTEKIVNDDRTVTYKIINDNYFLINDDWNISFIGNIEQFKSQYANFQYATKNIKFDVGNINMRREAKYIAYSKLFNEEWSLKTIVSLHLHSLKRVLRFINEKYPTLNSLLDLNIEKATFEWIDWLEKNSIKTVKEKYYPRTDRTYQEKTVIANFLFSIYGWLLKATDTRVEWSKDIWDARNLEKYGVNYIESSCARYINFTKIKNHNVRTFVKKYFKQRFLSKNKFSFEGSLGYIKYLPNFINYVLELEPTWNDLKELERYHIEKYIEWLSIYTKQNLTRKNSNPEKYQRMTLTLIRKFLIDIQMKEYEIAPYKDARQLIFADDMPKLKKKPYDRVDYVPDFVLEQLFSHIKYLKKDIQVIVWIMYKTGLRISDVLGLKQDCLVKLNGKYWIETDIKKPM